MTEFFLEILDTISRNKSRSLLTAFGIFWGIFMLVLLIGGTHGLKEMLNSNFSNFAKNAATVWSSPTTKVYKGFAKGREWEMDNDDVVRLRNMIPELDVISPQLSTGTRVTVCGDNTFSATIYGVDENYQRVCMPEMKYGRYINAMDLKQGRKVCVIGKRVYETSFPRAAIPLGAVYA